MSGSGTGIVTSYNTHRGIDFDGAADAYARAADLVGNVDGPRCLLSWWFRVDGGAGLQRYALRNTTARFLVALQNTNQVWIRGRTAGGVAILEFRTTPTYLAGSGWHHVMACWDTTLPAGSIYVDGAVPALAVNTVNAGNIDYTRGLWGFGADETGATFWNGGLSEFYGNFAEYLDLTVVANQEQLRHPNGQPPSLLADASGPTGTQPLLYMVEEGGVIVNRGSGGAFVAVGAPALSADSPKDRWVASLRHRRRKRRRHAA